MCQRGTLDPLAASVLAELQRRGWPIERLATLAGVHRCTLSRWLAARRTVRLSVALRVVAVLGLHVVVRTVMR